MTTSPPLAASPLLLLAVLLWPTTAMADGLGALASFVEIAFGIFVGALVAAIVFIPIMVSFRRRRREGMDHERLVKRAFRIRLVMGILSAVLLFGFGVIGVGAGSGGIAFFGLVGLLVGAPLYIVTIIGFFVVRPGDPPPTSSPTPSPEVE